CTPNASYQDAFFFSSRRRHTRSKRDWSSDVCSSDLGTTYSLAEPFMVVATANPVEMEGTYRLPEAQRDRFLAQTSMGYPLAGAEIGRASCRESVCMWVVGETVHD